MTDKLQPRPTRRQFYNAQTRCSDRCRGQVTPQANTLTRVIGLLCKTWPSGNQTARVLGKRVEQRQAYILGVTKLTCSSDTWRSPSLRGLLTQYTTVSVFVRGSVQLDFCGFLAITVAVVNALTVWLKHFSQ